MGVYIKDIEIPSCCDKCICRDFVGVDLWKCKLTGAVFNSWEVGWGDGTPYIRHKSCPLISVNDKPVKA